MIAVLNLRFSQPALRPALARAAAASRHLAFAAVCSLPISGLSLLVACDGDDGTSPPATGSIEVTTSTTGDDLDPDGYTVTVDGGAGRSIEINGSMTFTELAAGSHEVRLAGAASNCTVAGTSRVTVTVTAGGTATVAFEATCVPLSLVVLASTTGSTLDPDGYTVTVDGGAGQSIMINGTTTIAEVGAGDHEVELTGVAPNCTVVGSNPRTVTLAGGGTDFTRFDVGCALVFQGRIAFATTDISGPIPSTDIFVVTGTDTDPSPVNLTNAPGSAEFEPAWSPDGTKIAFTTDRDGDFEIYVMNADGSDPVNLTNDPGFDQSPAWSPDGTKIAFSTGRDGDPEIYVMNPDGSDPVRLTNDSDSDGSPAWSHDGTKIAFTTNRDVDGDGFGDFEIYVMNADGSDPVNLTNAPGSAEFEPAWSPDGTKIAFSTTRDGESEIYVMNADGSDPVRLTNDSDFDGSPAWSPDGTKIAFETGNLDFDDFDGFEIYVMNADGSNPENLTNTPGAEEFQPAWAPE